MRRTALLPGLVLLGVSVASGAGTMRAVVADLPYDRVFAAAVRALEGYPIERVADGVIATGWRSRAPRPDEPGFERVEERVTLRVEPFGERVTRVTVEVDARGWREGAFRPLEDTRATAREVLARLREAQG